MQAFLFFYLESFIVKGKTPLQKHSNSTGIHKQLAFSNTYTRRETSHKHVQPNRKALSFSQITIKSLNTAKCPDTKCMTLGDQFTLL